jgi:hypothetical protein
VSGARRTHRGAGRPPHQLGGRRRAANRVLPCALLICCAVFTRETTVIGAAGLFLAALLMIIRARPDRRHALRSAEFIGGLGGLAAYAVVQIWGFARFGKVPFLETARINAVDGRSGIWTAVTASWPPADRADAMLLVALTLLIVLLLVGALTIGRSTASMAVKLSWIGAIILVASLNANPWGEPKSFLRAATEFGLLTYVVVLGGRRWARVLVAVITALVLVMNLALMVLSETRHLVGLTG